MLSKKERKKRKEAKETDAANDSLVSNDDQNNKKEKKAKKRKLAEETKLDWAEEVENENPAGGESPKKKKEKKAMKNGMAAEEPAAKKTKKEKPVAAVVAEEVQEKGAFRKIFYRPTEATVAMTDAKMMEFRQQHKMNLTGRMAEIFKPVQDFDDFSTDPAIMSVCKDFLKPTPIQVALLTGPFTYICTWIVLCQSYLLQDKNRICAEPVLAGDRLRPGHHRYCGDGERQDTRLLPARPPAHSAQVGLSEINFTDLLEVKYDLLQGTNPICAQVREPYSRHPVRAHHAGPLPHQGARHAEPGPAGY
jgi:hypothetical protein